MKLYIVNPRLGAMMQGDGFGLFFCLLGFFLDLDKKFQCIRKRKHS